MPTLRHEEAGKGTFGDETSRPAARILQIHEIIHFSYMRWSTALAVGNAGPQFLPHRRGHLEADLFFLVDDRDRTGKG